MPLLPIILSGGAGARLWPLSREATPKSLLPLPGAAAGDTLLARTFARAASLPGVAQILTITHRDYYFQTRDAYAGAQLAAAPRAVYLLEPFARNTAPAVALGALYGEALCGGDATLLVLPADHLIGDTTAFTRAVARAGVLSRQGFLVTFGIAPTAAETGYGYLELGEALAPPDAFRAAAFAEKPPPAEAARCAGDGRHVWNSGIFCFTARYVLDAFDRHAPRVLDAARAVWQSLAARRGEAMLEIDPALFASAPEVSFDVAVMEKAGDIAVVRADFDWSDVGSWRALSDLTAADAAGNRGHGERVAIATRDTYVHAEDRVVATVGVEGLYIVDTPDALLVAHRDELQRVREVVAALKAGGHDAYRRHRSVLRPWGAYTLLQQGPGFKIKRVELKPGAALALKPHAQRSEHWIVVAGEARVSNGDRTDAVRAGESTCIRAGSAHRLENSGPVPLLLIEVQCGDDLGEDDSVRFDDEQPGEALQPGDGERPPT